MDGLHKYPVIGLDTEATGLNYPVDRAFCIGLAFPDGKSEFYDLRRRTEARAAARELSRYRGTIVCHYAAFDMKALWAAGIQVPLNLFDCTMVRAVLIDEGMLDYSLETLVMDRKEPIWDEMAERFGGPATKHVQAKNLVNYDIERVKSYCIRDAALALRLWQQQEVQIDLQRLHPIHDLERRVLPVLVRMEMRGVRVDLDYAERARGPLTQIIDQEYQALKTITGRDINVNSTPQIRELFDPQLQDGDYYVGSVKIDRTKSEKGPSLNADVMRKLAGAGDIRATRIIELRSLLKTRDTFLQKHVIEHAVGDRVYPTINQTATDEGAGTRTGRLSYTDPALHQIPSRNKRVAAIVKPCFLPDEGHVWVSTDLASHEVRVFAHFVAKFNEDIRAAYKKNPKLDFHQYVADLTGLVRNATYAGQPNAKQLNLSMIFCQGRGATAEKMGMGWWWDTFTDKSGAVHKYRKPGPEAIAVINQYHMKVPGVRELAAREKRKANDNGFIATYLGRRCRFPDRYKTYKASGLLIQATAADLNKQNCEIADQVLEHGHMILNTHDSYELSIEKGHEKREYKRFQAAVCKDGRLRVPLILDLNGTGSNWWEAVRNK